MKTSELIEILQEKINNSEYGDLPVQIYDEDSGLLSEISNITQDVNEEGSPIFQININ